MSRYEDDIQLAKNLGITAFRFSIEWHHIEPQQGVINQAAIAQCAPAPSGSRATSHQRY